MSRAPFFIPPAIGELGMDHGIHYQEIRTILGAARGRERLARVGDS